MNRTMVVGAVPERPVRVRDPKRREKILVAAESLFAVHGFHAVSMADIGREAEIVGSGVYRHFDSKVSVLVALLDKSLEDLVARTEVITAAEGSPQDSLERLVDGQIEFCLKHRLSVSLYRTELTALDDEDARRLKLIQRGYNNEWVAVLIEARPGVNEATARLLVHATIGAIQTSILHDSGLDRERQTGLLRRLAQSCLAVAAEG